MKQVVKSCTHRWQRLKGGKGLREGARVGRQPWGGACLRAEQGDARQARSCGVRPDGKQRLQGGLARSKTSLEREGEPWWHSQTASRGTRPCCVWSCDTVGSTCRKLQPGWSNFSVPHWRAAEGVETTVVVQPQKDDDPHLFFLLGSQVKEFKWKWKKHI